jgi:hypothetical protein
MLTDAEYRNAVCPHDKKEAFFADRRQQTLAHSVDFFESLRSSTTPRKLAISGAD